MADREESISPALSGAAIEWFIGLERLELQRSDGYVMLVEDLTLTSLEAGERQILDQHHVAV